jgi:RNA polymerase-binding transcription factor DksA
MPWFFFTIYVDYLDSFDKVAPLAERKSSAPEDKPSPARTDLRRVTTKKKEIKKMPVRTKAHASASAAAILGRPVVSKSTRSDRGPKKVKVEWQKYYDRLLELREQLMRQMNGLAKESAQEIAGYSLHMADSGTDNFDRDFALSLLSSDQDAVYEIEEALKRIERETYGVCELTSKAIPKARLEAIPWARFTVQAQAQLEREGALRQRRLGQLGTVDAAAAPDVEEDGDDVPEEKPAQTEEQ